MLHSSDTRMLTQSKLESGPHIVSTIGTKQLLVRSSWSLLVDVFRSDRVRFIV